MAEKTMKVFITGVLTLLMITSLPVSFHVYGQHETEETHPVEGEAPKFDPKGMILHHVSDAHEINFVGEHLDGNAISIYLPVILKTDDGWDFFWSSKFYENPEVVEAGHGKLMEFYKYKNYIMFHEKIYYANADGELDFEHDHPINPQPFDLSITRNISGAFLAIILLFFILRATVKGYRKNAGHAPKGIQSVMETLILFVRDDIVRPAFDHDEKRVKKYAPFLLTLFFFIWFSNMLGLIPFIGGFNITGTIAITLVLAAFVFVITTLSGKKNYWTHIFWPPGGPIFVKPILVPIEFATVFIKPTVLMVRLTANMVAGHIIILSFVSLILIFGAQSAVVGYSVGVGSTLFMVFMYFIELLVAFIQAYVFTILASIYFNEATKPAQH